MLRFWHVCLLVLIALIWKVRPASATVDDVCYLSGESFGIYCQCEVFQLKLSISCFVLRDEISDNVRQTINRARNVVALKLQSYGSAKLSSLSQIDLKNMDQLETLTILDGKLGELEKDSIANLPSLYVVNLERNDITSLHRFALQNIPSLNKLVLSENLLTEILADSFSGLDKLEKLFLDRNNISRIENCAFCNLHNLRELDLRDNNLMDLSGTAFKGLRYVTLLDLSYNKLRILNEKVFQGMPRLDELNLEENHLTYVSPRAFHGLGELRILKLNYNKLKTLPDHVFHPLPKLLFLSLTSNGLETIPYGAVESLHNALDEHFSFAFSENPLKCSCDLSWISRYHAKTKSKQFQRILENVRCANDSEVIIAYEMPLKDCKVPGKKAKLPPYEPVLSTLESNIKDDDTQANPKYDSDDIFEDDDMDDDFKGEKGQNVKLKERSDDGNLASKPNSVSILLLLTVVTPAVILIF